MVVSSMMITDGGGGGVLPSLADLPAVDTDAAALLEAAELMAAAGGGLRSRAEETGGTWDTLPAVYTASGTEPLYSQLQPLVTRGDSMATALTTAGDALREFAIAVGAFRFDHQDLTSRITSVRSRYWETEPDSWERSMILTEIETLRGDISSFAGRVEIAEETCADALAAIRGGFATGVSRTVAASGTSYVTALDAAVGDSVLDQLEQLAQMTPEDAAAWLAAHPEFADALAASPPPAEEVNAWWLTLGDPVAGDDGTNDPNALQLALITAMPSVIGNLNGVPYWGRSDANVMALDIEIAEAYEVMMNPPAGVTPNIRSSEEMEAWERWRALRAIADALKNGGPTYDMGSYQLIELNLEAHPPLAAISSGNLDDADYATFVVPGMNTTVENGMEGLVNNADALALAQQNQLGPEGGNVAVVAWIGYETPGYLTVFGNDHAEAGATALENTLGGYNGTVSSDTHLNLLLHSYGSTTGTLAVSQGDYQVDDVIAINSPGVIVEDAGQMNADQVWAATPPDDMVVDVGNLSWEHPHLPRDPDFGAHWYEVPDTTGNSIDAHGLEHHFLDENDQPYGPSSGDPGQALQQIVDITLGNDDEVQMQDPDDWQEQHDQYIPQMPTEPGYY
ncbi:alpha/beta hydrolase [Pseudactinotalea sp.]|uniref:alpha/beta hydrolase n=1 Tax=Pseudactinotalea sp. TaxID=1926260 RepID=UPI003B3B00E1